jgi:hypothetical protein
MSSTVITIVVKMMESLPVDVQEGVAENLREYIDDLQDEIRWNESFQSYCFLIPYTSGSIPNARN